MIKGTKIGKTLNIVAKSKNKIGFGISSAQFTYQTPTSRQVRALESTQYSLEMHPSSRSRLIARVGSEGFSNEEATYDVDLLGAVNW